MRNLQDKIKNRIIKEDLLLKNSFVLENNIYILKKEILENKFIVQIEYSNNVLTSKLIEVEFNDEYLQADSNTTGEFSGNIKEEYENTINEVINNISIKRPFKNKQLDQIIKYIKNKYNDELEFLWEKYDDTAVIRNKKNNKWYFLVMEIEKSKLGLPSEEKETIIDLTYYKGKVEEVIDEKSIFQGYHMNKKSWITVLLDGTYDIDKIYNLIDISYNISIEKK